MIRVVGALFALLAVWPCVGVETEIWVQNELADFEKGTLKKLSVRSDGRLLLAPVFEQIVDTSIPYLWAIAGDGKGTLFVAGGGQGSTSAQILAIDATGKHRVYADVPGMQVQALAVDRNGTLFAGTSPDGKVYRVTPGKAEVFYDPKAKYIWAMGFNSKGDLYVATGDGGEVHRVTPNGQGSVFFRTEETHARSLAIDPKDNIIVGTEPSGLILRVAPNGEGFVVYQSAKREVTAVAVGKDGLIYAAAVGNRSGRSEPSQLSVPPLPIPSASIARPAGGAAPTVATAQPTGPQPPGSQPAGAPVPGGSEFYRIESDGFPRKLWSHPQEIIYAVGFDANGVPILATGNKGKLFRVDSENVWTLLIDAETTQITALHRTPDGRLYAATGNIGKVFRVGPGLEKTGSYESEAYDAGSFSYWGRVATKGAATIETRSGNLERTSTNWSPWAPLNGDRIASPPARFLQYRATLTAPAEVSEIELAYEARNVAPSIDLIEITPPNYKFPAPSAGLGISTTLSLPPLGQKKRPSPPPSVETTTTPSLTLARYFIGARWTASDPNNDELEYTVLIRGERETEWKTLKEKIREKYISWDSSAFPDGGYFLSVIVSDAPDNTPDQALSTKKESDRFVIDNTPPKIANLTATRAGKSIHATWSGNDALSNIVRAEYSLNGGDWTLVQPVSRLFDAPNQQFDLNINDVNGTEITLAVRLTDEFDNQSVEKIVVR